MEPKGNAGVKTTQPLRLTRVGGVGGGEWVGGGAGRKGGRGRPLDRQHLHKDLWWTVIAQF